MGMREFASSFPLSIRQPLSDLRAQPESYPALWQVDRRARHRRITALIGRHTIAVAQPEHFGHAVGVDEIVDVDLFSHRPSLQTLTLTAEPSTIVDTTAKGPGGAITPRGPDETYKEVPP
jgi:hypothetical protein